LLSPSVVPRSERVTRRGHLRRRWYMQERSGQGRQRCQGHKQSTTAEIEWDRRHMGYPAREVGSPEPFVTILAPATWAAPSRDPYYVPNAEAG
jgi:hypothetical protein